MNKSFLKQPSEESSLESNDSEISLKNIVILANSITNEKKIKYTRSNYSVPIFTHQYLLFLSNKNTIQISANNPKVHY